MIFKGLKKTRLYTLYNLNKTGFLKENGWFLSFLRKESINERGEPIPWMTYSSISFLGERIKPTMHVFEFGCGNSTLWWSKRVSLVIACEHDHEWHKKMLPLMPKNASLFHLKLLPVNDYSKKILEYDKLFDVVILDGRDRVGCAKNSLNSLKPGGILIWDNSEREEYQKGFDWLSERGYKKLDFHGMGPINVYGWCTSIFYKDENCLNI